ncbi:MAG TPA: hypothetical protein VIK93_00850 [Limnochordales bacterium]
MSPSRSKAPNREKNARRSESGLRRGLSIGLIAMVIAIALGGPLGGVLQNVSWVTGLLTLAGVIGFAILADILAVAAAAGDEVPLNAMAADRVVGAREAILIVRNASTVNSIFGDVIGDICGTISGVVATPIILSLNAAYPALPLPLITMAVLGVVAFFTIGGKAAEKAFAVRASTSVLLLAGKGLHYLHRLMRLVGVGGRKRNRP